MKPKDRKEYFKTYNQERKAYLNQKQKERYHKLKELSQSEGVIKKVLNKCDKCGTAYLLIKK